MKLALFTILSSAGMAFVAPRLIPKDAHILVRTCSAADSNTCNTYRVFLNQRTAIFSNDLDSIEIVAATVGVNIDAVTCKPTWHFSSTGAVAGLAFTSDQAGSPGSTFGNGMVSQVDLTCSLSSKSLLNVPRELVPSVEIEYKNIDGSAGTFAVPIGSAGGKAQGYDLASVEIVSGNGINPNKVICQPTWFFDTPSTWTGSKFKMNLAGSLYHVFGINYDTKKHNKVYQVQVFCDYAPSADFSRDSGESVVVRAHHADHTGKEHVVPLGAQHEIYGSNITKLEITSGNGVDPNNVVCEPVWFSRLAGGKPGMGFKKEQVAIFAGDLVPGVDSVDRVALTCKS
ncbi:hypothetical protein Slin14017_G052870 [Septoria linicola]|nr:hypothetical protein Slin14017_G052870 [Septoria linicola]